MTLEPQKRRRRLSPRTRLVLARIVVVVGAVLGLIGLLTARWGLLFAGIVVIGLGAAMGPARARG
ncbi:hypothetical protein ACWEOH_09880 [Agromyces sp. NPDC004153]|nr:hypothetical protein [Agromyces mariniharenae]